MTNPIFGRVVPVHMEILSLIGYRFHGPDTAIESDEEQRLELMHKGHAFLVETTKADFGFDLSKWREFLLANGDEFGYTHPYAFQGVDQAVVEAINDAEFNRLATLLNSRASK